MAEDHRATGLIGGIEKRTITIIDYDPGWPQKFEIRVVQIGKALGAAALRIEHIGSTSVPGLAAKPIIDILLVVSDSADESTYLPALEGVGYVLRVREPEWNEHRMLRTPEKDARLAAMASARERGEPIEGLARSARWIFGPASNKGRQP